MAACGQDMRDQPRHEPLEASPFFDDGGSARPLVPGTMPNKEPEERSEKTPAPLTLAFLRRGQERYDIFCSVCHDRTGEGNGMIVQRGYPRPPSLHLERLRQAPDSYFYDVITRGFGRMPDYAAQIPPEDRWAIAAYVRALQLSRQAPVSWLDEKDEQELSQSQKETP
jgi:mono/diheme cytochrome c family protein